MVREVNPVHISPDTEPDTNVLVVTGGINDYQEKHPGPPDVVVLIEVADTSMDYDLGEKALLYAQAGVTDYWVALPAKGQIVVHRNPSPEGYGSVVRYGEQDAVSPLAASNVTLSVRDLLGDTAAPPA